MDIVWLLAAVAFFAITGLTLGWIGRLQTEE